MLQANVFIEYIKKKEKRAIKIIIIDLNKLFVRCLRDTERFTTTSDLSKRQN